MVEVAPRKFGDPWYLRLREPRPLVVEGRCPVYADGVIEVVDLEAARLAAGDAGALVVPQVLRGVERVAAKLLSLEDTGYRGRVVVAVDPGSGSAGAPEDVVVPGDLSLSEVAGFSLADLIVVDALLIMSFTTAGDVPALEARAVIDAQASLLRQRDRELMLVRERLSAALSARCAGEIGATPPLARLLVDVSQLRQRAQSAAALRDEIQDLRTNVDRLRQRRVLRAADRAGRFLRLIASAGRR